MVLAKVWWESKLFPYFRWRIPWVKIEKPTWSGYFKKSSQLQIWSLMSCYKTSVLAGQLAELKCPQWPVGGHLRSSQRPRHLQSWLLSNTGRMTVWGERAWSPRKSSRALGSFCSGHPEALSLHENTCLSESFKPGAAILIQSFSFQAVEPFWLAACYNRKC